MISFVNIVLIDGVGSGILKFETGTLQLKVDSSCWPRPFNVDLVLAI